MQEKRRFLLWGHGSRGLLYYMSLTEVLKRLAQIAGIKKPKQSKENSHKLGGLEGFFDL